MPPEPLPFDRKDFFKERKPSSSDPAGVVPVRWREPPTTPSSHPNNHGSFSYRWGGAGGSSDFRRPFSGHGKQVGGGLHVTTVDPASHEDKFRKNSNSLENNQNINGAVPSPNGSFLQQKDQKGGSFRETSTSPNGNFLPHSDFDKVNGQRLENENSLGSSIDWKPIKWIRSGSLSSRGSGFSHSSSPKSIGVDSLEVKTDVSAGNNNNSPVDSPSGDGVPCLTPRTPADEVSSRKKARLGWGEGLAKYEKKKVGPDDIVHKDSGARNGMVDGVSSSEALLNSPVNVADKSPSLTGCSECASPATPSSFACSSSPGVEEKASVKAAAIAVDNDICNPSGPSCHLSPNHTEGPTFNLENLELTEVINLSSSLNELLQSDDTSAPSSGFVRSTAMDKLQVWKADISRTLEITETEIDSLENELKSLNSNIGASSSLPAASCSLKITSSDDNPIEKADNRVEDLERESPGTATSKFIEPLASCNDLTHSDAAEPKDSSCILDIRSENTEGGNVLCSKEEKLHESIFSSNKAIANESCDELSSSLLPSSQWCSDVSKATNDLLVKENFARRKHFLKFKERVITLKFRAFQYLWKEDLRLLSVRRFSSKSHKKCESSSRNGFTDFQKHRSSIRSRFSSPAGNLSLVPTAEIIDYANKLLSDSQVKVYRNTLKMPSLILDKRERMSSRFISDNGLVENPIDVEKEKSVINPWTSQEEEIFLEKFSLFGKHFRKIATFLDHKTVADCVEFYYKNHKSDRFQKIKEFAKQGKKSHSTNTYLVTSGKRWNRETNAAASLDMLGAASAMAANVEANVDNGQKNRLRKCTSKFYQKPMKPSRGVETGGIIERSNNLAMLCNERETAAADVLAGICGSISSEALSSCITSLVGGSSKREVSTPEASLNDVDEETCSDDDSCGGEIDHIDWTDEEKLSFVQAVRMYGKDFSMISRFMRTRSRDQCKVYYSKARNALGLDSIHVEPPGTNNVGGDDDHGDTCMVDSGSVISCDKSSSEFKMDIEDLHSSDSKKEVTEIDVNVVNKCRVSDGGENKARVDMVVEEAADSDANFSTCCEESAKQMNDQASASGSKVEVDTVTNVSSANQGIKESQIQLVNGSSEIRGLNLELNVVEEKPCVERVDTGFSSVVVPPHRKTLSQDDISSRLSFRKSGDRLSQRSSSTDGYHLHLPKHSLMDCVESPQVLRGFPLTTVSTNKGTSLGYHQPPPQQNKLKLENLLLPRDCSLQMCTTGLQRNTSPTDVGKQPSNRSGDVKLFGQILTNTSSHNNHQQQENDNKSNTTPTAPPQLNERKSFNLKFDNQTDRNLLASLDLDRVNTNHTASFGADNNNNLPLKRSYGFWDGNRIQTGFPTLPDSSILLAKYPAAFSTNTTKLEQHQRSLSAGFQTRELGTNNYHPIVPPFTVDKLLSELPTRRKETDSLLQQQQGRSMVVGVAGACNGVSDPVAAIRMHYAKTEQHYKNGSREGEPWRTNSGDIGSR